MKKVLVTARLFGYCSDDAFQMLRNAGFIVVDNPYRGKIPTQEQLCELIDDVDGIIVGNEAINKNVLSHALRLSVISRFGTGIDNIDLLTVAARGIILTKVPGVNSDAVADMAFAMLLSVARQITALHIQLCKGHWPLAVGAAVNGRTIGIVGLGQIGRKVAMRARGFQMNIIGSELHPDHEFIRLHNIRLANLDELLRDSDFISLHCPLTSETHHLIGRQELSIMKPTAFLINTARGGLIDEHALYDALLSGQIAGAASDAFEHEPLHDSPLLKLNNFIATPHIAFCTREVLSLMEKISVQNLMDVFAGRHSENIVDLSQYGSE
jgi:D-3-phosphoglycerate dehydrogenase